MSLSNTIVIAATEIRQSLDESKPILENIKTAMKLAKNHWCVIGDEERFKSAIGAVLLIADEENKQIIEDELKRFLHAKITKTEFRTSANCFRYQST